MAHTFLPSRLEAFSDGVIAVIITIMVLELKVPHEMGWAGLRAVAPILAIYLLSFAFVGIYWVNHHMLIDRLRESSPRVLWANLIWLFCLSLIPFFTSWVLEKERDPLSVALYAGSLLITALSFMLLRLAVNARQRVEGNFAHEDSATQRKHWFSMGLYVLALPLAFYLPLAALLLLGGVTLLWVVPTLGVERCAPPSQHASSPAP